MRLRRLLVALVLVATPAAAGEIFRCVDEAGDVRFEPRSALQAGDDGMEALARITACAYEYLRPGGWLVLEHGYDQGEPTTRLLQVAGYGEVSDHKDAAGLSRVSLGRRPAR